MSADLPIIEYREWEMAVSGIADMVTLTLGPDEYITLDSGTARSLGERLLAEADRAEGITP